jgi:hypothetical protein
MSGDLINSLSQGRVPIGDLLVNLKKIDANQLQAALSEQAKLNVKLGEVLVNQGFITQQELDLALAVQNNRNPEAPMLARKKLGDLLLDQGTITTAQLQAALENQNLTQKRIGDVLLEMGFVNQTDIDSALKLQDSLAFSSRQRILDSLQARNVGDSAQVKQTGPLPTDLHSDFQTRAQFLDTAGTKAFAAAFGRQPDPNEIADLRSKLAFVFPDGPKLNEALAANFDRATAYQKLSSFFQNVVADRITQLAGGDTVSKQFDNAGNVEVTGLSQRDLELAIEIATQRNFQPQKALEQFIAQSARALFKSSVGRDFSSADEEAQIQKLLDGPQGEAIRDALRRLQGLLRDTFSSFPLAWGDQTMRASLTPDQQELDELLKAIRDYGEKEALRLFQEKEWWFRKLELARTTEAYLRSQLEAIKVEQQVRKILDLVQQLLGKIPPGLMKLVRQLMGQIGSGSIPNLAALEAMIVNLFEKVLQMFQAVMGRPPSDDELAQALEMVMGQLAGGASDPMQALQQFLTALKDGKSPQGGLALDRAIKFVNQMNFEFLGQINGIADPNDAWVQALVNNNQTPESMKAAFKQYYKDGAQGVPLTDALAFVEFLNLSYRGVKLDADPFDPDVQKLLTGKMTPGEVDREWKARFSSENQLLDPTPAPTPQPIAI